MVNFLIVGTARSGTTLVQRLACELPNVHVPPETRFFEAFASRRLRKVRFPLTGEPLRREVTLYRRLPSSRGLDLDVDEVIERLDGHCDNYPQLFHTLVATLARAGDGAIIGEKTPIHLQWWRPIMRAMPDLRIVAVVRDPRSVVASYLQVWKSSHLSVAARWRSDQQSLIAARQTLGNQLLVLRYEDIVHDPASARGQLRTFFGITESGPASTRAVSPEKITVAWEWWKSRVTQPVTTARVSAWQDVLTAKQASEVLSVCRRPASLFGYPSADRRGAKAFSGIDAVKLPMLGLAISRYALDQHRKSAMVF